MLKLCQLKYLQVRMLTHWVKPAVALQSEQY